MNEGIVESHRRGVLTAATLMANGEAFEDAVRLAKETPELDVGCHLVLIGGRSLLPPYNPLPATAPRLLAALARREIRPYEELAAQARRILDAGLRPTHLDTHKHTHLAPPVLDAVARIAEEFGIRWVRRPFDFPGSGLPDAVPAAKRLTSAVLRLMGGHFRRALARRGCQATDPLRRIPDYGPAGHNGTSGVAGADPSRNHGADVPSGALPRGTPPEPHTAEREPRAGTGGADLGGGAPGDRAARD